MRELFKSFAELKSELRRNESVLSLAVRRMTPEYVAEFLDLPNAEASRIQSELIAEGWIHEEKLTPTRKGMGLAQHIDREKISRAEAEALVERVISWAVATNAKISARVKIKEIHLYGSLQRAAAWVDDVDLFVEFTTMDLGMDLQPEDMELEHRLCEELCAISDRLSPSTVFDRMSMHDVPTRKVFPSAN